MSARKRQPWTKQQKGMIVLYSFLVLGGKSVYGSVKELMESPLMAGRSWESVRGALNRQRKRDNK